MITEEEALRSLKKMKNNKSPETDEFSVEFLKFFFFLFKDIGTFVVRSANFSLEIEELSVSQKQRIIVCIPQGDKDRQELKNWRPTSLLNVSLKIISTWSAERMKKALSKIWIRLDLCLVGL